MRREEVLQSDPELAAAVELADRSDFIADVASRIGMSARNGLGISERQRDAVVAAARRIREQDERRAEEAALPTAPVPAGRQQVTGTVVSTRREPTQYGYGDVRKMLVRDDLGFKLWMNTFTTLLTCATA